jgi:hypothetical protein
VANSHLCALLPEGVHALWHLRADLSRRFTRVGFGLRIETLTLRVLMQLCRPVSAEPGALPHFDEAKALIDRRMQHRFGQGRLDQRPDAMIVRRPPSSIRSPASRPGWAPRTSG